jgi:L-rhamnose-H+ transport protein
MQFALGLVLVLISGAMAGSALAPIKFMRKYAFENYWVVHSLIGTVVVPWALAFGTVPDLLGVYRSLPASVLMVPAAFAFSWGIASTLGGLCVSRIGLSLSYALIIGIGAVAGALIPMLYFTPEVFATRSGELLLSGVAVMIAGLVVVTRAGRHKERLERSKAVAENVIANSANLIRGSFLAGLGMAVLAGILSAGLNFSFAFGSGIAGAAVAAGASKTNATYAVWAIAMLGGMVPNLAYALIRCARNDSWRRFAMSPQTDIPLGILMGTLFMGSTALYGMGAVRLGVLGASVGWGIMQVMQIVVGNLNGFITGEWTTAGPKATRHMFAGIAILVVASALMALGNYVETHG